jgi:hypothetical protein
MSQVLRSHEEAALALLASARDARDQEIEAAAQANLERSLSAERQASLPGILGKETLALAERMRWLAAHPKRRPALGGCAIKMTEVGHWEMPRDSRLPHSGMLKFNAIATPPLLATDPEFIDGLDGAAVRDGYVFMVPTYRKRGRADLVIEHRLIDERHDEERPVDRYVIDADSCESVYGWAVCGDAFDDYRAIVKKNGATFEDMYDPATYPDELYNFPIGLVTQARQALKG